MVVEYSFLDACHFQTAEHVERFSWAAATEQNCSRQQDVASWGVFDQRLVAPQPFVTAVTALLFDCDVSSHLLRYPTNAKLVA